jgi:outer membrane protein OmpA-like peptidoglycan-associated protein
MNMKGRALLALCIMAVVLPVKSQDEQVLKEGQADVGQLVDALAPPRAPVRTRSLGLARDNEESPAGGTRPAKVSLLITFDTNSANLTPNAKHSLDVVGKALASEKLASYRFAIEGHADPRGSADANLKLSQLRAQSVRDYLVQNVNIDKSRLEAIGKGDRELMNKVNVDAPENRRVTIVNLSR